eukprot:1187230-Prorocentrum_minimum.AAC.5
MCDTTLGGGLGARKGYPRRPLLRGRREYSRPQPTGRTHVGNIPGFSQRGGLMKEIFQASANGADSCREYSRPQPTGWTRVGNIPGLNQRGGLVQGIFRANGAHLTTAHMRMSVALLSRFHSRREYSSRPQPVVASRTLSVMNTGLGFNWVSNGLWIHSSTFWSSGHTWGSN